MMSINSFKKAFLIISIYLNKHKNIFIQVCDVIYNIAYLFYVEMIAF